MAEIWQKFVNGKYVLCVSNDILEEYEEVLGRNINSKVARLVLAHIQILPNVKFIDPHYSFGLIKADEDDNKFVDCAIACELKVSARRSAANNCFILIIYYF